MKNKTNAEITLEIKIDSYRKRVTGSAYKYGRRYINGPKKPKYKNINRDTIRNKGDNNE